MKPITRHLKSIAVVVNLRWLALLLAIVLCPSFASATSDAWDGSTDGVWGTSANWLTDPALVPGTGETATFNITTPFSTIDLGAGVTISNVLFDTASAAAFTIGSGAVGSQTLTLSTPGDTITVNSTVASNQSFNANLAFSTTGTYNVRNDSANTLTIAGGLSTTSTGIKVLSVDGTGNTTVTGAITSGTGTMNLVKTNSGTLTLSGGAMWSGGGVNAYLPGSSLLPVVLRQGTTIITGGTYTNNGEFVVGGTIVNGGAGNNTKLIMTGGALGVSSWFSVGKGNGIGGVSSEAVLSNNASIFSPNYSLGWNQAAGNFPKVSVTLNNTSFLRANGSLYIGESVGADATLTVNDSACVTNLNSAGIRVSSSGKGTLIINGGTVVTEGDFILNYNTSGDTNGSKVVLMNGGILHVAGSTPTSTAERWLIFKRTGTANTDLVISNGTVRLNNQTDLRYSVNGGGGTNTVTIVNGAIIGYSDRATTVGGDVLIDMQQNSGASAAVNVFNLDGGVVQVRGVISAQTTGTRTFNFNGGTLKPNANNASFFNLGAGNARANVRDGGAVIDTAGFNITIAQPLLLSDVAGDASTGGLTKIGNGTLVLSGGSTYNGPTTVRGGTLGFDASLTTPSSAGNLTVSNATLTLALNNGANSLPAASVTLQGSTVLNLNFGNIPGTPATAINATGSLVQSGNTTINITGLGFTESMVVPLITTTAPASTNGFALGPLPPGVYGVLTNNTANSLDLLVTAAAQLLTWYGSDSAGTITLTNWDINTSTNWNTGTAKYIQYGGDTYGDIVTFNDSLSYSPVEANNVNLLVRVLPSVLMVDSTQPYSFAGPGGIDGATSLLFTNTGLFFLGTSNGYTGGTIVGGGTLTITNDSALGANAGPVTLTGGNLQLGADLAGSRPLAINANAFIGVSAGATAQWGGVISGTGDLNKSDSGTLTTTATNTTTGHVYVRAGTLIVDSGGVFTNNTWNSVGQLSGDSGSMTLKGTGAFFTTADFNIGDIDNAVGTLDVQDSATLTANGFFVASANNPASTASGTVNQTGGTVTEVSTGTGLFAIGGRRNIANDPGSVGTYNISGGTLIANTSIRVGGNGIGTINQSGSSLILAKQGINIARITGSFGTNNLDGGTLETFNVASSTGSNAVFNFNGGTLKAYTNNAAFFTGLTRANVRDNGGVIDTAGFDVTIAQPLEVSDIAGDAGTGGITKTGNGTLTLTGTNTYVGTTAVTQGTLALTPAQQVTSMPLTLANGTKLAISAIGNGVVKVGNLTAGSASSDLTAMGFGLITGTNPLSAVLESGTLTLNGTNTVSLSGLLNAGTFPLLKHTGAIAGSGYLNTNALTPHGYSATVANIGDTIYVTVSGAGGIVWQGYNTDLALTNLWDKNSTTNWLSGIAPSDYVEVTPPGDKVVFDDTGSGLVLLSNTVSPASVLITNNATSYTFQGSGHISGIMGLTKTGTGSATMAYVGNDYTGATVISAGTLSISGGSAIGDTSAVTLSNVVGVALNIASGETIGSLAGGGTTGGSVILQSGELIVGGNNATTAFDGNLSGSGSFRKRGTGTMSLGGAYSASSGDVTVDNGALNLTGSGSLNTRRLLLGRGGSTGTMTMSTGNNLTVNFAGDWWDNGALALGQDNSSVGTLNMAGGTNSVTGAVWVSAWGGTGNWNQTGGTANISGDYWVGGMQDNNTSQPNGSIGTAIISNATLNAGNVAVGRGNIAASRVKGDMTVASGGVVTSENDMHVGYAGQGSTGWGSYGTLNIENGGIVNVASTSERWMLVGRYDSIDATVNVKSGGTLNLNAATDLQINEGNNSGTRVVNVEGLLQGTAAGGSYIDLNRNGGTGGTTTLNITNGGVVAVDAIIGGANTTLNFDNGTLKATADDANFIGGDITAVNILAGGAILNTDGHNPTVVAGLLEDAGSTGGGLTKTGNGTLTLNGVNTYTGTTTVSNGTLGGIGTITGPVVVTSAGTLAPGASIGTLTINGNLTLNAGSTNVFEVDGTTPANDVVIAGASVTYGGVLRVVPSGTLTAGQTFTLFTGAGAVNPGNFASIQSSAPAATFSFTNGVLTVVSVINTNAPQMQVSVAGNILSLGWPTNAGWLLQSNSVNLADSAAWFNYPANGAVDVTSINITMDPAKTNVFYRMVKP